MTAIELPDLVDGDIRLRPPTEADVPAITKACQDPAIQRWTRVPSPYTEESARWFVSAATHGLAEGSAAHLLVVAADDDDMVLGSAGLDVDGVDFTGELGYWVAPEARGRGIAVRAGRLLLRFAFEELQLAYVSLHAAVTNEASNRVASSLGFTLEGTQRNAMLDGPSGDRAAPRCHANLYGILPGELT